LPIGLVLGDWILALTISYISSWGYFVVGHLPGLFSKDHQSRAPPSRNLKFAALISGTNIFVAFLPIPFHFILALSFFSHFIVNFICAKQYENLKKRWKTINSIRNYLFWRKWYLQTLSYRTKPNPTHCLQLLNKLPGTVSMKYTGWIKNQRSYKEEDDQVIWDEQIVQVLKKHRDIFARLIRTIFPKSNISMKQAKSLDSGINCKT